MKTTRLIFGLIFCSIYFSCSLDKNHDSFEIGLDELPLAEFEVTNNNCEAPCNVLFINNSERANSYIWDFGDGSPISNDFNPTHTYSKQGDYIVQLTAIGENGRQQTTNRPLSIRYQTFSSSFGLSDKAENINDLILLPTGEYVLYGEARRGELSELHMYVIYVDVFGNLERTNDWFKGYGSSIELIGDQSFLLCGAAYGIINSKPEFFLRKMNYNGGLAMEEFYGGNDWDFGVSAIETNDQGFIMIGSTNSYNGGEGDFMVVKTDGNGNEQWREIIGGGDLENAVEIGQLATGEYYIAGRTKSYGSGDYDFYLAKLSPNGNILWENFYGGSGKDYLNAIKRTNDNGFILCGEKYDGSNGGKDVYLVKVDNNGVLEWEQNYGGERNDLGMDVVVTEENEYVVCGLFSSTFSLDGDVYIFKVDAWGNLLWENFYGEPGLFEQGNVIKQTPDGGFLIGGGVSNPQTYNTDALVLKTDPFGNVY